MKKITKQATNFSFPVSKGALLPFDAINLKFIAFFVFFFALLTIPTIKISASSYTEFSPATINNFATSSNFIISASDLNNWWDTYKHDNLIDFTMKFYQGEYPETSSQIWSGTGVHWTETHFKNDLNPIGLSTTADNGAYWFYIKFLDDYFYARFYKTSAGWSEGIKTTFSPIFVPSYPPDCYFTIVSTSTLNSFNATGTIEISTSNLYHWFNFSVIAEDFNTAEKHYFSTSTDLDAGDIFNYSIPISLPAGSWKISYLLQGVYFETSFFATHWCEHTGIGTGLPLPTWKEITEVEFLGLEDCSSYPLLERLVCDLKNAIKRIFVPSAESITALKTTIDGLKNKAPMSYISITKNFFDDVKTGINSSQNLAFKILNKTGNVSFAFWESETNLAGETQTFSQIFKTFFIFLLIFSFLIWAIFYVRKIFK
jgi:hypothetical protein